MPRTKKIVVENPELDNLMEEIEKEETTPVVTPEVEVLEPKEELTMMNGALILESREIYHSGNVLIEYVLADGTTARKLKR